MLSLAWGQCCCILTLQSDRGWLGSAIHNQSASPTAGDPATKFHPPMHCPIQRMTDSAQTFNFWESRATLLTQSSIWTLCKLVQLHCMCQGLAFTNKTYGTTSRYNSPFSLAVVNKSRGVQTVHWPTIETWECRDESKD